MIMSFIKKTQILMTFDQFIFQWMGITNGSISFSDNTTYKDFMKMKLLIPNGQHRYIFKAWNDKDPNIMTTVILSTMKVFTNDDQF